MAQLALSFAARTVAGIANALVGSAITSLFAGDRVIGSELEQLYILQSTEGAPIPIVYGRVRTGGQVIWADNPVENRQQVQSGGKGGSQTTERRYSLNFAVGLCDGVIDGVGRIWADGQLLDTSLTHFRLHTGAEDQQADSLIQIIEGVGNTPAFKGLAYLVFEDFPLSSFGNRIPQLSFEVFRTPPDHSQTSLRHRLRGVTLIPSSGEFAYATTPILADLGPGTTKVENINNSFGGPDIIVALDDLERTLPACDTVSLVVSWFGDDLRMGTCQLRPGVEFTNKVIIGTDWAVNGIDRAGAHLVSQIDERPAFGGTPSDASILQAIAEIKARGFRVVFYPFILMDIPSDNTLVDPYTGGVQPTYPWRGRITCDPAPSQPGSPDKSAGVGTQINAFVGDAAIADFSVSEDAVSYTGAAQWSLRRMTLHYAHLCALAGGVDAFIIGSELRGLTRLRSSQDEYPMVDALCALAQDAASILPTAEISYAADWSEYFGHQPQDGTGDVYFHLDPLWAHPAISFVGIDWYVPLSDWREGAGHLDAAQFVDIYDPDYLATNMNGGEGYDWFYGSIADREAQIRTLITDGAAGKPWVFRYKDLANWWGQNHFNRPGGVEIATPTAWVPMSKPIWFTETGCPAADKGSNQPNVFFDPKSSESHLPYFSNGQRDDLIQRRYIEAMLEHWQVGNPGNPHSTLYDGPMIDPANIQFWTWDARPFPDFPARLSIWSDGGNWSLGHWLNGRVGFSSLGAIIADLCHQANISDFSAAAVSGVVTGYVVRGGSSVRNALAPLAQVYGFDLAERFGSLFFFTPGSHVITANLSADDLAASNNSFGAEQMLDDAEQQTTSVRIQFSDDENDYQPAETNVRVEQFNPDRLVAISVPLVADHLSMKKLGDDVLARSRQKTQGLHITVPPSQMTFEVGDVVRFDPTFMSGQWQISRIEERGRRELWFQSAQFFASLPVSGSQVGNQSSSAIPPLSRPIIAVMDIPLLPGEPQRIGPRIAAFGRPWNSRVEVKVGDAERVRTVINRPAILGHTITALPAGGVQSRFDESAALQVLFTDANLLSVEELEVLSGQNSLAVQHDDGVWEVLQFQFADLQADGSWLLQRLLRGQSGTDAALDSSIGAGALVVLLDGSSLPAVVEDYEIGSQITWRAGFANQGDNADYEAIATVIYSDQSRLPRKPVHLRAAIDGDEILITWIRRTRIGGDNWHSPDVPLAETQELYLFELWLNDIVILSDTMGQSSRRLTQVEISQFYPSGMPSEIDISVSQVSPEAGTGVKNRQLLTI